MVIHSDNHGDENYSVVKQMQLDPRNNQLQDAGRHRRAKQVMVKSRLANEQQMLDMVPELYDQRDSPPFTRDADKAPAQHPDAHQHDQRVTIM